MSEGGDQDDDTGGGKNLEASSDSVPSAADSITASQTVLGRRPRTLLKTGFQKPLPALGRMARLWASLGLMLGRRLSTVVRDDHAYLILMAALVGVASGAAAGLLLFWIESAVGFFPKPSADVSVLRWGLVIGVPVAGGLLAGLLHVAAKRFLPNEPVRGVPGVIEAITRKGGNIQGRGATVAGVGTGLTIGSGGSCGHEGPSVAIGAAMGSVVARFLGLRMRRQMAMVGAGCAGGIAAAFNAPLAGVIFTVELVFGGAIGGNVGTMSVFIPLIVSAVSATFVSHAIHGERIAFGLQQHTVPSVPELAFYVLLAVLAGVIGAAMSLFIRLVRQRFETMKAPEWVKPALGALGVGIMAAVFSNQVLGAGHSTVDQALHGHLVWQMALLLLGLKILATGLTVGSGGYGGVFMPSLYVGSCLGTLVGMLAALVLGGEAHDPSAYALVGMGAVFAGLMHAPLTPIVMLFELTHDYGIILPLMLCCILSMVVSRRISKMSFYQGWLADRGVIMRGEAEGEIMRRGRVGELMVAAPTVLTAGAGIDEIRKATIDAAFHSTFVVDDEGEVIGFINGDQLAHRILLGEVREDSTAEELMNRSQLALLYPDDTLAQAMAAFSRTERELLPVVDEDRRLKGVLRRGELLAHYNDKVLGEQQEIVQVHAAPGGVDQEVGLGKGLVLERLVVGRGWAGRSLGELELRAKTGVTVLEWVRDDEVVAIDPRKPLREGDILAVIGTHEQILETRVMR
jgi:CIC family chloride channel protein